jgi:hypothetical protein
MRALVGPAALHKDFIEAIVYLEDAIGDLSFGPFRLLLERRLLPEGDRPVRLGSRAVDILVALVDHPGEVVGKNELIARVWPNNRRNSRSGAQPRSAGADLHRLSELPIPTRQSFQNSPFIRPT